MPPILYWKPTLDFDNLCSRINIFFSPPLHTAVSYCSLNFKALTITYYQNSAFGYHIVFYILYLYNQWPSNILENT